MPRGAAESEPNADVPVGESLLATKFYIPAVRPNLVSRPRLAERLDAGLQPGRRLILLSAQAGSGKTTLLVKWLRGREGQPPRPHVGWLSLDDEDNDPARFLAYLTAALRRARPETAAMGVAVREPRSPAQPRAALVHLINETASLPGPILLVLDDYHLIQNEAVHDAVSYLLDHLPPAMRLVLSGRADPPLPLSRLRVREQIVELRQADLRFTLEEAALFLRETMGITLPDPDVARLEQRTEGWIAALQLAALSLQGMTGADAFIRSFSGTHHHLVDYLAQEVFRRQPAATRAFLLQTSILERLSAPLCDAVTGPDGAAGRGSAGSQFILEQLEAANLFVVPLDGERRWYRYHPLFAEFLRRLLGDEQAELVPRLHLRASRWYEREGLRVEAIDHALAAHDFERAAGLIEAEAEAVLMRSQTVTFLAWLEALPDACVRSRPTLSLYYTWALLLAARPIGQVLARLHDADRGSAEVSGLMAVLRGFLATFQGQEVCAVDPPHRLFEKMPQGEPLLRSVAAWFLGFSSMWGGDFEAASWAFDQATQIGRETGNLMIAALALCHRAELFIFQGNLPAAASLYEQALSLAVDDQGNPLPIAGVAQMGLGELARERNDLDRAGRLVEEGLERIRQWGELGALDGYITLVRLRQAQNDGRGLEEALAKAGQSARRFDATELDDRFAEAHQARIRAMQGRLAEAERWAESRRLGPASAVADAIKVRYPARYLSDIEWSVQARLLIGRNRFREALAILAQLLAPIEEEGRWGSAIELHVLRALALQASGERTQAMAALERALSLAEPGGYVRVFADEGAPLAGLLRQAAVRGIAPEYVGRLLAAVRERESQPAAGSPGLIEPLSDRETEVLRLVAAGLSNQEIAGELVLAVSTVKWHINNLYGKLGVNSRTQALARARDLRLL